MNQLLHVSLLMLFGISAIGCATQEVETSHAQEKQSKTVAVQVPAYGSKNLSIPDTADIHAIEASVFNHPFAAADVPTFRFFGEEMAEILKPFRDAKVKTEPNLSMVEIASLRVIPKNGASSQRLSVFWYNAKQTTICFSLNGVRCITNSQLKSESGKALDHALFIDGKLRNLSRLSVPDHGVD